MCAKPMKEETQKHLEAFEFYYQQGEARSLQSVHEKFGVGITSLKRWSASFSWRERVMQRDKEAAKLLADQTTESVVNEKAGYRAKIKVAINTAMKMIDNALIDAGEGKLKIRDAKGLAEVTNAIDKLVRLDMDLLGDDNEEDDSKFDALIAAIDRSSVKYQEQIANIAAADNEEENS